MERKSWDMDKVKFYSSYCSGCGLCKSVDQTNLKLNKKGFLEPDLNNVTFQEKYCPISRDNCSKSCESSAVWGDYISVLLGYSKNPVLRHKASSGGVLSELASFLLDTKLVDGVIHVGVGESPLKTQVFCSTSRDEIISHAGSRYAQSTPLESIENLLQQEKKFSFIGKPCDVMILKTYLLDHPEYQEKISYFLSFFCAGMPSLNANKLLIEKMGCNDQEISSFDYRGNGWPGYATARTKQGIEYKMAYENAWGRVLGRDKHKLCRVCMDGIGLFADVACGDAWNISKGKPDFSEGEGRNLIIIRNKKGEELVEAAIEAGYIYAENYDSFEKEMPIIQKYQYERRSTMASQIFALKLFAIKTPKYKLTTLVKYMKFASFKAQVNIFWGTLKRIGKGRYK